MRNFTFSTIVFGLVSLLSGLYITKAAAQNCTNFQYLFNDDTGIVYSGQISGGNFVLTLLLDPGMLGDIAINEDTQEIYVIDAHGANIKTFDQSGTLLSDVALSGLNSTYAIAWHKADGKLYVGNNNSQQVFTLDPVTGAKTLFANNMPLFGGDLISTDSGELLLVRRGHSVPSKVYDITSGTAVYLYDVVQEVFGAATTPAGDYIMAEGGSTLKFHIYNSAGVSQGVLNPVDTNGNPFPIMGTGGDMASACLSSIPVIECSNFKYYYIAHNTPGVSAGSVYGGDIVGGDFVLTYLFNAGNSGHMAFDENSKNIYVVSNNGSNIKTFDSNGILLNTAPITGLNSTYALVWHKADGLLYVGNANTDKVYTLDPLTGDKTLFANNIPVQGGDMISTDGGQLLLVRRIHNNPSKVYDITSGSAVFLYDVAKEINGAALTSTGGYIMAEGSNSTNFHTYDASGNPLAVLNSVDNLGNPFHIYDGDMASGCMSSSGSSQDGCDSYSMFYTDYINQSKCKIYRVDLNADNTVTKTFMATLPFSSTSSAVSPDGKLYISNRYGTGFYVVYDVNTNTQIGGNIPMTDQSGNNIKEVGGSVFHDGMLYVNVKDGDIYALDPATGQASASYPCPPGKISDILFDSNDDMWVMDRDNSMFRNLTAGTSFSVPLYNVDGIALLPNGNFVAAEGGSVSLLVEVDPNAEALTGVTYDINLNMMWGDLSGVCLDSGDNETPGQCYATEVVEYVQGTTKSGGVIIADKTHPLRALGAPERGESGYDFVSLGYGGSIILGFDGSVPNEDGDDLEIVETTYGDYTTCESFPEYADVYVSVNGSDWHFAKTVCKYDGFVDISDAGTFEYINYVKIVNNNTLSTTVDAYDVDGVVALHNCEDGGVPRHIAVEAQDTFTVYPNPTSGPAVVEFTPALNGTSMIQVIDMSGRIVKTIFNQDVEADQTYRISFDGSDLPNGIYITKLTTDTEVSIEKIMIAR